MYTNDIPIEEKIINIEKRKYKNEKNVLSKRTYGL